MARRRIIQRIVKKSNSSESLSFNEDCYMIAYELTGLHTKVLKELETADSFETTVEPIQRSVIYDKLVQFYTVRNKMPTTFELFNSLHGAIPPYIDIAYFKKILVKMGFLWRKVSNTGAAVIEDPLVRFERYNYLKKIQFYRSTATDIYYIETGSYDSYGNFRDMKLTKNFVADVLQKDWVQKVIYALGPKGIHAWDEIEDFQCDTIEEWIRDSLLPTIDTPSVFLLRNCDEYNRKVTETPTLDSLKSDTKRWLDRHLVAYDDEMSKYELFALAERYTDLNKVYYKIDDMLKCEGHSVLRIPKCIEYLSPPPLLARLIGENLPKIVIANDLRNTEDPVGAIKSSFKEMFLGISTKYIEEFEGEISDNEKKMIEIEDRVDNVYDSLLLKAAVGATKVVTHDDSDLPSGSDSD